MNKESLFAGIAARQAGMLMQTVILIALTNFQVQEAGVALDRMYEFTILEPEYTAASPANSHAPEQYLGKEPFQFEWLYIHNMGFRFPAGNSC